MKTNSAKLVLEQGKQILKAGGIDAYAFEAACLFMHFCGISRTEMIISDPPVSDADANSFIDGCQQRVDGEPLQYIIGHWEFYGIDFIVNSNVLIPRADTETLIDYILENRKKDLRVLDMCCGSGCIGLTLKALRPDWQVTLCDISSGALAVTRENAKKLGLEVTVKKADLTLGGNRYFKNSSFDIIVSNPPYITEADMQTLSKEVRHEPYIALYGGKDGTDFYRALIEKWQKTLALGGELVLESGYDTADDIQALFCEYDYNDIKTRRDLNGITRMVGAKRGII